MSQMEDKIEQLQLQDLNRELIGEEIILLDRDESEISHWWKTSTLLSYFLVVSSGLASSISIGDLVAAFQNECIFYGKLTLTNLDKLEGEENKTPSLDNIVVDKWGNLYDCQFCEFASTFSVVFGGMMFAMFLQCGHGGTTTKSQSRSWEIVIPALLINIIFFIIGSVIFGKTIGGLSFFCTYILRDSHSPENITSCAQVLSFRYPWDYYGTDLYLDYVFAQVGAVLTFVGWMSALTILIFRCVLGVDFVAYRQRSYVSHRYQTKTLKSSDDDSDDDSSSVSSDANSDSNDSEDSTSFITVNSELETKKLI